MTLSNGQNNDIKHDLSSNHNGASGMNGVANEGTSLPDQTNSHSNVLIVGGGPVGSFLALKIAQTGISVTILESEATIVPVPRAIGYLPIVLREMEKIGVLDDVIREGFSSKQGHRWSDSNHKQLAYIPASAFGGTSEKDCTVFLGQHRVTNILQTHLKRLPNVQIKFSHRLVGLKQSKECATAMVRTPDGEDKFFTADYVVGCDGASSAVRRTQCIPYEGFTFSDFVLVAADILYDFEKEAGWTFGSYIVHPEHWAAMVFTGSDGIWRVSYGESSDVEFSKEAVTQRFDAKMRILLPGTKKDFKLKNISPYYAHQRCAKTFREDRILLCGDAAHANNPVGGLGLTGGLLDATVLGNAFNRVYKGESEALLDMYAEIRRKNFLEFTNPTSIANMKRLNTTDPKVIEERNKFFKAVNNNPEAIVHEIKQTLQNSFKNSLE